MVDKPGSDSGVGPGIGMHPPAGFFEEGMVGVRSALRRQGQSCEESPSWPMSSIDTGQPLSGGISTDSRTLPQRSLYVPLKGHNFDGHDFIAGALSQGATGFLYNRDACSRLPAEVWRRPGLAVEDTERAYLMLAKDYRERALSRAWVIAVTGSVGKSTLREYLRLWLSSFGPVQASVENHNNQLGVAQTLFGARDHHDFIVAELGMRGSGDLEPLVPIVQPHVSVLTCVAETHMSEVRDLDEVYKGKLAIFRKAPDAVWVGGADDERILAHLNAHNRSWSFGGSSQAHVQYCRPGNLVASRYLQEDTRDIIPKLTAAEVTAWSLKISAPQVRVSSGVSASASTRHLRRPSDEVVVSAPQNITVDVEGFYGDAQGEHVSAGICVLGALGLDYRSFLASGQSDRPGGGSSTPLRAPKLPQRFSMSHHDGFSLIDDAYNASPVSMRGGLKSFFDRVAWGVTSSGTGVSYRSIMIILGDMLELGDRSGAYHYRLGSYLAMLSKAMPGVILGERLSGGGMRSPCQGYEKSQPRYTATLVLVGPYMIRDFFEGWSRAGEEARVSDNKEDLPGSILWEAVKKFQDTREGLSSRWWQEMKSRLWSGHQLSRQDDQVDINVGEKKEENDEQRIWIYIKGSHGMGMRALAEDLRSPSNKHVTDLVSS